MTIIKRLEIISFGKFKNFAIELKPGLNELIYENEFGKSTITDFILFMLYGFTRTASKKVTLEENLLKKYLPWQGEPILSGAMELECDGRFCRIERTQNDGRKKSVSLRSSGGAELEISDSPGKMLFGVDSDTFERTFLIRQTDIKFSGTSGLEAALKNLVTTGDEDTSYEAAAEILRKKNSRYRHIDRQSGRIFDIRKSLSGLELEISRQKTSLNSMSSLKREMTELQEKAAELDRRSAEYRGLLAPARGGDARRTLEKLTEIDNKINLLSKNIENLESSKLGDDKLNYISKTFIERDMLQNSLDSAENSLIEAGQSLESALFGCPEYDTIRENEQEFASLCYKKPQTNAMLCALGTILAAVGIAVIIFGKTALGAALTAIGAITVTAGFIFKKKVKIPQKYGMTHAELKDAYKRFADCRSVVQKLRAAYENAVSERDRIKTELESCLEKCGDIKKNFGISNADELSAAASVYNSRRELNMRIDTLREKRAELLSDKSESELKRDAALGECEYSEQEVQSMIYETAAEKNRILEKTAALSEDDRKRRQLSRSLFMAEQKKRELEAELEDAVYQNDVLTIAREALHDAYEYISDQYSPLLTECAKEPLSRITDGKYDSVYLDRDFNLRIKSNGSTHELGYFSRGTMDSVYFAVRTAVCDLIADRKSLPLIMDDPFWSFDSKRLENARKFTEKAAKSRQIIIFSARK